MLMRLKRGRVGLAGRLKIGDSILLVLLPMTLYSNDQFYHLVPSYVDSYLVLQTPQMQSPPSSAFDNSVTQLSSAMG
jgi:hypothetical protein